MTNTKQQSKMPRRLTARDLASVCGGLETKKIDAITFKQPPT
jgi:hypothetical protein